MFQNIDPVALGMLSLAVAGAIELLKRLFDKDWKAAATIAVAALVGGLLGPQIHTANITWIEGMLIGLSASGLITTLSYVGSNNSKEEEKK